MEIRQVPEPAVARPTDVLIEIDTVGVCGSDMHYYRAGRIGCQIVQFPWIVGHECAGVVQAVGAQVRRIRVGDRVAVDPLVHCGRCDQCRIGHTHTCRDQSFLGCPGQLAGSLCERLVMPEASCFAIPDAMTMTQATMAEPFSIALWAQKLGQQERNANIAILGAGPIGLSVLAACKAAGPCTVFQTDLLDGRLALARRLGADWTANAARGDATAEILARQPLGLDIVFECAGRQEAISQALDLVKPCCKVVIVGIPEGDTVQFEMNQMRRKEIRIQNVRRQLDCVEPALEMLAAGSVNLDPMITHEFEFDQVGEAFSLVADYRDNVVKAMIRMKPGR
jgi:L-iditol 2-dehydrogenase